jgi:phytoene dehydrogenase-like protein
VAARLAATGHAVTVCESAAEVGGKLGLVVHDEPGLGAFRFDTGPSLLTLPQVFRDLFEDTGGWPDGLSLEPLDPTARYRFADGTGFDASPDLDTQCRRLDEALQPGSGDDWRAFHARAGRVWEASRTPFLESALDGPGSVARLAARSPRDIAAIAPGRSLRSLGRRHLRDPGCAPTSTGTPPTPARTRAGRRPRWPPCRTSSRSTAAGTSRAGCTGWGSPCGTAPSSAGRCCARARRSSGSRRRRPRLRRAARRR